MPYKPQAPIPENINRSDEHPLFSLVSLVFMVGLFLITLFLILMGVGKLLSKTVPMKTEYQLLNSYFSKKFKTQPGEFNKITNDLWLGAVTEPALDFNPTVIKGKPNAMILPGGKIFLTRQFLQQTESENELSFVLCHELGHFFHRHTIAGFTQQILTGLFQMLTGVGSMSTGLNGLTQVIVHSSFSRSQETDADEFALGCLNARYGHVNGHSHFFEKLKKTESGFQNKFFRSHPVSQDRIDHLQKVLTMNNYSQKGELTHYGYKAIDNL